MLCFRCGSHVNDEAERCWNCATDLGPRKRRGPKSDLRPRSRSTTRAIGVVHQIGDVIADRYRVKDIVGSGGAGVVYRAADRERDIEVAVKVLNGKLVQTRDERRVFARYMKIARALHHDNCVRILDDGMDGDRPYWVMPFLEGLSLRRIIDIRRENGLIFSVAEIRPIFEQLLEALTYAHRSTIHGNLKPDNVLVLPDLLQVTDFLLLSGLPRKPFLELQQSRGRNLQYFAPEVRFEVSDLSPAADLYSLGVILGEMLTGYVHDDAEPARLDQALTKLAPALAATIRSCLKRIPQERFRSISELRNRLQAALDGSSSDPASDAPTERLDIDTNDEAVSMIEPVGEPSVSLPIEEYMIESELAAQSQEVHGEEILTADMIAEPIGEDDLIDDPSLPPALQDEDDEETLAIEEPDEQILAARARIDANRSAVPVLDPSASTSGAPPRPVTELADEDLVPLTPALVATPVPDVPPTPPPQRLPSDALIAVAPPPIPITPEEHDAEDPLSTADMVRPVVMGPQSDVSWPVDSTEVAEDGDVSQAQEDRATADLPVGEAVKSDDESELPLVPTSWAAMSPSTAESIASLPPEDVPSAVPPPLPEPLAAAASDTEAQSPIATPNGPPSRRGTSWSQSGTPSSSTDVDAAEAPPIPLPPPLDDPTPMEAAASALEAMKSAGPSSGLNGTLPEPDSAPTGGAFADVAAASGRLGAGGTAPSQGPTSGPLGALGPLARRPGKERPSTPPRVTAMPENLSTPIVRPTAKQESKAPGDGRNGQGWGAGTWAAVLTIVILVSALGAVIKVTFDRQRTSSAEIAALRQQLRRATQAGQRGSSPRIEREAEVAASSTPPPEPVAAIEPRPLQQRTRVRSAPRPAAAASAPAPAAPLRGATQVVSATRVEAERAESLAAEGVEPEDAAGTGSTEEPRADADGLVQAPAEASADDEQNEAIEAASSSADPETPTLPLSARLGRCPLGMTLIQAGPFMMGALAEDPERNFGDLAYASTTVSAVCVDTYEYPNRSGQMPKARVTWAAARNQCQRVGKRLCTEAEWEKACKGRDNNRYVYGKEWDPLLCNTENADGDDRAPTKSGTFTDCRSQFGVFDLAGNVAEWTATAQGQKYIVKGGGADRPGYDSRCAARGRKEARYSSDLLGFRCCKDPE